MSNSLSHFDDQGASRMVDVGAKPQTRRAARASATVVMSRETLELIQRQRLAKGDVLEVARLAGIMAAKQTSSLIPLCHPLPLDAVQLDFTVVDAGRLRIQATVSVWARTGVEMEALTAVTVAGLTVYDMCKSIDRGMVIQDIELLEKSGGSSGHYRREASDENPPTA